jgi:hypothetical protein
MRGSIGRALLRPLATIDHPATSLGPRCAIATVNRDHPLACRPSDHPTIDHRERLWDRGGEIATRPFAIFPPKKLEANTQAGHPAMLCRTSAS